MEGGEERSRRERVEEEVTETKWETAKVKVEEPCLASPALQLKVEPKVEEEEENKTVCVEYEKEEPEQKTSPFVDVKQTLDLKIEIKEDVPERGALEEVAKQDPKAIQLGRGKEKAMAAAASEKSPEMPPLCSPAAAKSPGKPALGLPDQSGLIVGVNTINYDASLRNKSKTREEKKMEMILKAIEAMERAEARKRSDPNGTGGGCGESFSERSVSAKRRRSSSAKKESVDSAVEASSADEGGPAESKNDRQHKGRRRRHPTLRRRSRAKSGDSTSAMSADEGGGGEGTPTVEDSEAASTPGEMQPFKFPRHK